MITTTDRTRDISSQVPIPVHFGLGKSNWGKEKNTADDHFHNGKLYWRVVVNLLMGLTLLFGSFSNGYAKAKSTQTLPTIMAESDARVSEAKPQKNFGKAPTLSVEGSQLDPDIETYIRFTVSGITGSVSNAQVRLFVTDATQNGPSLYTTSNDWNESDITWNNRPARTGDALADKEALAEGSWADYDVTNIITGDGTYSFVLATDSDDVVGFSSREGSSAPELVLTLAEDAAPILPSPTVDIQPTTAPIEITAEPTVITVEATDLPITQPEEPMAANSLEISALALTTNGSMWIPSSQLMSLPTSGTAWNRIKTTAYGSWGTADLKNQDNKHAINTLAGALVYARTGDAALRLKVKTAILAAKRSLDASSEWQTTNGVLAAGRQIGAYVIAADLIKLGSYDAIANTEFKNWLITIRTTNIGTHGRWKNIKYTCENATGNWSTFACASRIAASIYLGDATDVNRSALIIRALLGERSIYPADAPGENGYFKHTDGYLSSWSCNVSTWTGANPACSKSGVNVSGVLVEDASRGGGCCVLKGDGIMYSWEALQGLMVSTELLYRTGSYGNPYTWSTSALKRSLTFLQQSGWAVTSPATYVPWLANARYGTSFPTSAGGNGRIMAWGDWLYQK